MVYLDPQQTTNSGYFLGLLQSVENPLISPYDRNQWTSHEGDECLMEEDSQISGQNEVLSLPNLRVSMDDLVDEQNEEQSEPPVIRSTDCETGECSEHIRYGDSYTSAKEVKTMQEFKCQRSVSNKDTKKPTTRCGFTPRLKVCLGEQAKWCCNHFESVIFARVLLTNETSTNFKWAFKQFFLMMGGKALVTMLTDQANARWIAMKEVLPNTNHRWCKWHVLRKGQEVLGHVYKKYLTFSDDFHKLVNHMLTSDEFEAAWKAISHKYGLEENPFMIRAYECCQKCAKPYFKGIFCARMTGTQRSERANHVLKIYIPCNSSINRFIAQYSKLICDRESSDHECENNTKQKSIELQCGYSIEKHASMIYTKKVYHLFKMELLKSTKYVIVPREGVNVFEVRHVQAEVRDPWCKVNYLISVDNKIGLYKCECGLYEHFGIVCSHIIAITVIFPIL